MKKNANLSFEEAMEELEKIVEELEKGEQPLEVSMDNFKKGVEMSNYCENLLDEAEKSINILIKNKNGEIEEETFEAE